MSVLVISCNSEWDEEQYEQYISFKAPVGDKGVTDIYVRYKQGGEATYRLPMIVSGLSSKWEGSYSSYCSRYRYIGYFKCGSLWT